MKAFFKALVLVPLALVVVLFSVANRAPVRISLDPISRDAPVLTYDVPLFAIVLVAVGVGILIGGIAAWFVQHKYRKAARVNRREAERLRAETESLRSAVPDSALPALTGNRY
jgi:uncharacterized integral membrane protein